MTRLYSFTMLSLDGCFADARGDMSFLHSNDPEAREFAAENAKGGGMLVFGRITYEQMAAYWPTPLAAKNARIVAKHMNEMPKLVFSRTLGSPSWQNTRVVSSSPASEIRRLKAEQGLNMTILGSGSIVAALAAENLIDEYQLLVNPIILGDGKRLFSGVANAPRLELVTSRTFKNGNVFSSYRPR